MDMAAHFRSRNRKRSGADIEIEKKAFHGHALICNDFNLPSLTQTSGDLKEEYKKLGYEEIRRKPLNDNYDLIVMEKSLINEIS